MTFDCPASPALLLAERFGVLQRCGWGEEIVITATDKTSGALSQTLGFKMRQHAHVYNGKREQLFCLEKIPHVPESAYGSD